MKNLLTFFFLLVSINVFSQQVSSLGKYRCSNSWEINKKTIIKLGKASNQGGYLSIYTSPFKSKKIRLSKEIKDVNVDVISIERYVWDFGDNIVFAKIKIDEEKYYIDIEGAIKKDEIVLPNGYEKGERVSRDNQGKIELDRLTIELMLDSIEIKDDEVFYDKVIFLEGLSKDEIFNRVKPWIIKNFMDSKAVLEINDKQNGFLAGKGTYRYESSSFLRGAFEGFIYFRFNIAIKDEKLRIQLNNFTCKGVNTPTIDRPSLWKDDYNLTEIYNHYIKKQKMPRNSLEYLESMVKLSYFIYQNLEVLTAVDTNDISDF